MTHLSWAGSCMWENFASQARWASLGSTVTPETGWPLGTLTFPSQPRSRHVLAKEGRGLVQREHLVVKQPVGPPHQRFSRGPTGRVGVGATMLCP